MPDRLPFRGANPVPLVIWYTLDTAPSLQDAKLYKKVIAQCNAIVKRCGLKLRQCYRFIVPYAQRYAHLPKQAKEAQSEPTQSADRAVLFWALWWRDFPNKLPLPTK